MTKQNNKAITEVIEAASKMVGYSIVINIFALTSFYTIVGRDAHYNPFAKCALARSNENHFMSNQFREQLLFSALDR